MNQWHCICKYFLLTSHKIWRDRQKKSCDWKRIGEEITRVAEAGKICVLGLLSHHQEHSIPCQQILHIGFSQDIPKAPKCAEDNSANKVNTRIVSSIRKREQRFVTTYGMHPVASDC